MLQRVRGSIRVGLLASTLVAAVALPQAAFERDANAETSEKKKVAVGVFDGSKRGEARAAFIEALKQTGSYEVTDAEDVKASAKASDVAEAAKSLGVDVVITGQFSKGGLKLKVMNGADGSMIDEVEIKGTGGKLKGNIEQEGASVVAAAIDAAKVEPKEAPAEETPAEETPAEASAEASAATAGDGLSPFDLTVGLRATYRTFEFHDTAADNRPNDFVSLPTYELPPAPTPFIELNWYPASHFTTGTAEWLGLTGAFERTVATESVYLEDRPGERTFATTAQQWYVGGRFRLPLGVHQLGVVATFGQHTFTLEGDHDWLVPDVTYTNLRAGVDGTFRFGDIILGARVGKRLVLDTGGLEEPVWFSNVKTSSLEAGVTLGYRLTRGLDLVTGFDWLRYAFDFNPVPVRTDPARSSYVAGGAVDEYLTGHIALRFHVPGASEPVSASSGGE